VEEVFLVRGLTGSIESQVAGGLGSAAPQNQSNFGKAIRLLFTDPVT